MKHYAGHTDENGHVQVYRVEDGVQTPLPWRLDLRNHSPTGFNYGYGGSGPAQLALAILADHLGDKRAQWLYEDFKQKVIAQLPQGEPWTLTGPEIDAALTQIRKNRNRGNDLER